MAVIGRPQLAYSAKGSCQAGGGTASRAFSCGRRLLTLAWGLFDIGTDLALAFDLLKTNAPIGNVSLLCIVAPYFVPACLAFIWRAGGDACAECRTKPLQSSLFLAAVVFTSPLLGFMGGCGLFVAFHGTRLFAPCGIVPEPTEGWIFNIKDNSGPYQAWFTELVIGFWLSCVEDIPECIIALMVIMGSISDGNVTVAIASEICTLANFAWTLCTVGRACSKHNIPLSALATAHLMRA